MSELLVIISQKQLMVLGKYMINRKLHLTLNEGLDKTQYINKKDEIDLLNDVHENSSIDYVFSKTL